MSDLLNSFPEEMKIDFGNNKSNGSKKPRKKMKIARTTVLVVLSTAVFLGGVTLVNFGRNKLIEANEQKQIEALLKREEEEKQARLDRISNNKVAYLTFDDGPNNNTLKVLEILEKNNIKATFFVVGDMVKNNPDIVKAIYDAGHTLGNHTLSHSYSYKDSESFMEDILATDKLISEAIGEEYKSLFVRVPGGSMGKTMQQETLSENSLRSINWTGLSGDSENGGAVTSKYILNRIKETVGDDKYEVVLMHDVKSITAETLEDVIQYIKDEGYIFEPLMEDSPVYFK